MCLRIAYLLIAALLAAGPTYAQKKGAQPIKTPGAAGVANARPPGAGSLAKPVDGLAQALPSRRELPTQRTLPVTPTAAPNLATTALGLGQVSRPAPTLAIRPPNRPGPAVATRQPTASLTIEAGKAAASLKASRDDSAALASESYDHFVAKGSAVLVLEGSGLNALPRQGRQASAHSSRPSPQAPRVEADSPAPTPRARLPKTAKLLAAAAAVALPAALWAAGQTGPAVAAAAFEVLAFAAVHAASLLQGGKLGRHSIVPLDQRLLEEAVDSAETLIGAERPEKALEMLLEADHPYYKSQAFFPAWRLGQDSRIASLARTAGKQLMKARGLQGALDALEELARPGKDLGWAARASEAWKTARVLLKEGLYRQFVTVRDRRDKEILRAEHLAAVQDGAAVGLKPVPTSQQDEACPSCGIHMLFNAVQSGPGFDRPATPGEFAQAAREFLGMPHLGFRKGFSWDELLRIAEAMGYRLEDEGRPSEEQVRSWLGQGMAVLAELRFGYPQGNDAGLRMVKHGTLVQSSFDSPSLGERVYVVQDSGDGLTKYYTWDSLAPLLNRVHVLSMERPARWPVPQTASDPSAPTRGPPLAARGDELETLRELSEWVAPGELSRAAGNAVGFLGEHHPDLGKVSPEELSRFILQASLPFATQLAKRRGHSSIHAYSAALRAGEESPQWLKNWIANVGFWLEGMRQGATMSHTRFFRETEDWLPSWKSAVKELIRARVASGERSIVIKSVGSSTGEEAYTLAILLDRALRDQGEEPARWKVRIEAYDFNINNLFLASRGTYYSSDLDKSVITASLREAAFDRWSLEASVDVRPYFEPRDDGWFEVRQDIRKWIVPIWLDLRDEAQYPVLAQFPGQVLFNRHTHHYLHGTLHPKVQAFIDGLSWKSPGDPGLVVATTFAEAERGTAYRVRTIPAAPPAEAAAPPAPARTDIEPKAGSPEKPANPGQRPGKTRPDNRPEPKAEGGPDRPRPTPAARIAPPQLSVVFFRPSAKAESPVEKEYHDKVQQPKERAKIDALLSNLAQTGFKTPGIRFEKVQGAKADIYELKITAFGSEHRFLAGYAPQRSREGQRVLVLLKYIKKKRWRLSPTDIQTAEGRLARVG